MYYRPSSNNCLSQEDVQLEIEFLMIEKNSEIILLEEEKNLCIKTLNSISSIISNKRRTKKEMIEGIEFEIKSVLEKVKEA